jgi:predicted MFS family arabinose efflux permease
MSLYWLTWGIARSAAPLIGGTIYDQVAPKAIWWSGLAFGLTSTLILLVMNHLGKARANQAQAELNAPAGPPAAT